ncbi:filamentous growth regulator 23 [Agrilus planipennis]|uniref:Filamentous growth regulator 23 n=1 Tax=Agrilus planipennis TaxID=224129 RepID=A0A1W4XRP3_AGRPL|nr:filamentous growth regulator 23 [Agrilus planipennis]XP_025830714.1 filamentous growth regulator 23 [Agrilus planipennis]
MLLHYLVLNSCLLLTAMASQTTTSEQDEEENDMTRKVLGSSVVTSVSVIMDTGNGSAFWDAAGKPVQKPASASQLASPINLLNPDRYEFYTFNDNGDLIKRLMTLEEIQGIIASGDGEATNYNTQLLENVPKKDLNSILSNVQSVLKKEIESHQSTSSVKPVYDTPDVSSTWSMILPAIFGNSGDEIQLQKPQGVVTPETITIENATVVPFVAQLAEIKTDNDAATTNLHEVASSPVTTLPELKPIEIQPTEAVTTENVDKRESTTKEEVATEILLLPQTKITTQSSSSTTTPASILEAKTTQKENVDTPIIQVVITEKEPENVPESSPKPVQTTTVIPVKENDSLPSGSNYEFSTLQNVNQLELKKTSSESSVQNISTTEVPVKTKSTETILLILSTIKKDPTTLIPISSHESSSELTPPSPTTTSSKRETSVVTKSYSETSTKPYQQINEEHSSATEDIKNNTDSSTPAYEKFNKDDDSTVFYEKVHLVAVPSSTPNSNENRTSTIKDKLTETPDYYQSSSSETLTHELIKPQNVTFTNNPKDEVTSTLKYESTQLPVIDSVATDSNIRPQVSQGGDVNTGFNDGNLIQAMDDLISQIMGFNQTTIEYSSTIPGPIATNEDVKLGDEDLSRTESLLLLNLTETNGTKTNPDPIDLHDLSSLVTTLANINDLTAEHSSTYATELNQTFNDSSEGDILTFNVNPQGLQFSETTRIYQTTTEDLRNFSTTTIASTTDEKEMESLETSEDNSPSKNEISIVPSQTNNQILRQPISETTTERIFSTTDYILTTLNEDFTTHNIHKINSLISNDSDKESSQNKPIYETIAKEDDTRSTTTKKPIELVEERKPLLDSNNSSSNISNFEPVSPSTNELLHTSPSNNIQYHSVTESKNNLITEGNAPNSTDLYVRITAAPVNRIGASSSTTTLNYKPTGQTTENVQTTTTEASSRRPVEVKPTTSIPSEAKLEQKPVQIKPITTSPEILSSSETNWKLISTIPPPKEVPSTSADKKITTTTANSVDLIPDSGQGYGLEETTAFLDTDVYRFTELCNELSFSLWSRMYKFVDSARSIFLSPFATTSMLAMVFLGARGATSGEMNEVLKLDDMVTFNPHSVFKNVTDTIEISKDSGIAASVILRELYSDKTKGKLLSFYKERVRHFYDGHVEEVNFTSISDVIRRRTNLLVKRYTWGKIHDYLKDNAISARPPLAAVTASIFQTDCSHTSTTGRDGELHFVFAPTTRQRKLVPIPAAVWHSGFLAGYDPGLDATAVSLGTTESTVSTILVIPGQQGIAAPGDGLARLEERLIKTAFSQGSWSRLLKSLIPRPGLEVQIPRFAHRSTINTTSALEQMGLKELFNPSKADLKGLNGNAHEMYLSDLIQVNYFVLCGEGKVSDRHYFEEYPLNLEHTIRNNRGLKFQPENYPWTDPREFQRAFDDSLYDTSLLNVPLPLRPRQARVPDTPRLRFDRPFLYFVRHNPTGLILHMGRFNPILFQ